MTEIQYDYTGEYRTVSTVIVYLIMLVNNFTCIIILGQPPGPFCALIFVPSLSDSSVHLIKINMFTS